MVVAESKGWITSIDAVFSEAKDPAILDKLARDPAIQHAVQIRKAKVLEQPWKITGDPRYSEKLKAFDLLDQGLFWALDAIMTGRTVTVWDDEYETIENIKCNRLYRKNVSKTANEEDFRWFIQYPNATRDGYEVKPGRHLLHIVDNRDGQLGFGFGLNEALYHLYKFRTELLKYQMRYYYRFGTPTLTLAYDIQAIRSHSAASDEVRAMTQELEKSSAGDFLAYDKRHSLEFKEPARGIGQDFVRTQDWIDRQIRKLILGTALSTDVGDSGSYTLGKKQYENLDAIITLDRKLLSASINKWLLTPWWVADGQPGPRPKMEFFEPDQGLDSEQINANVSRLNYCAENIINGKPIQLLEHEVYQALGFTMPTENDIKENKVVTLEKPQVNPFEGIGSTMKNINNTAKADKKDETEIKAE